MSKTNKPQHSMTISPRGSSIRTHSIQEGTEYDDEARALPIVSSSSSYPANKIPTSILKQQAIQQTSPGHGKGKRSGSSVESSKFSKVSNVGLKNLGNTCFMNSALQCILHIEVNSTTYPRTLQIYITCSYIIIARASVQ